jgi:hypothetical protein
VKRQASGDCVIKQTTLSIARLAPHLDLPGHLLIGSCISTFIIIHGLTGIRTLTIGTASVDTKEEKNEMPFLLYRHIRNIRFAKLFHLLMSQYYAVVSMRSYCNNALICIFHVCAQCARTHNLHCKKSTTRGIQFPLCVCVGVWRQGEGQPCS